MVLHDITTLLIFFMILTVTLCTPTCMIFYLSRWCILLLYAIGCSFVKSPKMCPHTSFLSCCMIVISSPSEGNSSPALLTIMCHYSSRCSLKHLIIFTSFLTHLIILLLSQFYLESLIEGDSFTIISCWMLSHLLIQNSCIDAHLPMSHVLIISC